MRTGTIVAAVAGAPLLVAAAPKPLRLAPSSQWVVDYAENSCRLIRTFGEGKQKTLLLFESAGPGELNAVVVGEPLGTFLTEVPAKFVPVQNEPMLGGPAKSSKNNQPAILWTNVYLLPEAVKERAVKAAEEKAKANVRPAPIDLEKRTAEKIARQRFAEEVRELEIDGQRDHPVILETGSLGDAMKVFDECTRDSLRDWGVDPDIEDKIVRPVWAANIWRWFSADDYPKDMVFKGEESEVSVRLLVDASGKPTKCTSLSHFDAPEFNTVVCAKFMKRAQFAPAELADGTKVPSYYINKVIFKIGH